MSHFPSQDKCKNDGNYQRALDWGWDVVFCNRLDTLSQNDTLFLHQRTHLTVCRLYLRILEIQHQIVWQEFLLAGRRLPIGC